jgi:GNAT superfamily N-acetyltransferase
MEPSIRPARDADADAVVELALAAWAPVFDSIRVALGDELFERSYGGDWRAAQRAAVEHALTDEATHVWVREAEGGVAGFVAVILHAADRTGEIHMVAVAPEHQRQGHAIALTEWATAWIKDAGMLIAMVETGGDPGHAPARAVYEQAGYTLWPAARYFKAL